MDAIVDWEHYYSLYPTADQTTFTNLRSLAEREVRSVIGTHRWNSIDPTHFYYDQLRDCICRVINMLAEYTGGGAGKGLASVSNDGYSESYVVQTQVQVGTEIRMCIIRWLSGTGLVGAYKC
jgi:hypothetical protein